ncbi:chromosome segregation protein SMC [Aquifex pyrophilus]
MSGAYIEKLVVEGFKSYGTKRKEIPIGEGFVAVVGPNGAGKSNIGDAISFALGLSTAKTLRAKNLSYLIFSKNGKKGEFAEVEVHFRNLGAFPVEEEYVVISRRVNKEGRSVFKVNGNVVRERDLKDFLAKAGIYENAYNVVYQGDIVKFLKLTPLERRRIIEEVAGIGEYERKKEKALNELAEVEIKIKELDIILEEIEAHLSKLKEERDKLLKFRELNKKKREYEAKILIKEREKLLKEREKLTSELESLKKGLQEVLSEINKNKNKLNLKEKELKGLNDRILPYKENRGKLLSDIEHITKSIKEKEREKRELEEKLRETENLVSDLKKDLDKQEKELKELRNSYEKLLGEYESLKKLEEEKLKELEREEENLKITINEVKKLEEEKELILKKLEELKEKREKLLNELRDYNYKIEKTEEEIKKLEEEFRLKLEEAKTKEEELLRLIEIKRREEKELKHLNEELRIYEKRLKEVRTKIEDVIKKRGAIEGELSEHVNPSDVFKDIKGVHGSVSELISVKNPEHITAIEVAAGGRLRYIVVDNEEVAKECIQLSKRLNLGRFSFIPLNRINPERKTLRYPRTRGAVDFAVNLVEYDPIYEKVVWFVFGDTLIVEDFESAKAIGIGNYRMVTLDGELFEKSGVITGGSYRVRGELGRKIKEEKLRELKELEEKLKGEEEIIQKKIRNIRSLSSEKFAILKVSEKKIEELKSFSIENLEKKYRENINKAKEYIKFISEKAEKVRKNINEIEREIKYYEEKLNNLKLKEEDVKRHYTRSGIEEKRREYSKVRKKLLECEIKLKEAEKELNTKENEINYLKKELNAKEKEILYLRDKIKEVERELINLTKDKEKKEEEIRRKDREFYELMEEKERTDREIKEIKSKLGSLTIKKEEIENSIHEIDKKLYGVNEEINRITDSLREYEDLQIENVEGTINKIKEKLKKINREIELLGNVNFSAEEDYNEELKRYNDYREKRDKLRRESKVIKEMIEELEKKKKKVFMDAFRSINKNLKEIFSFLSPGGKASMKLENEEDPFNGGIQLTVKPRGKDVQYLEAMSGGEKTLAALSLIFAIQEYRPSPFYYFDEVDAHLDEANARKIGELIKEKSKKAQFIVVTLREVVASFADRIIGVSSRGGVSEVFFLDREKIA